MAQFRETTDQAAVHLRDDSAHFALLFIEVQILAH
jgi:hypothetical protein